MHLTFLITEKNFQKQVIFKNCLPHKLLLLKLEAYGMSKSALQLIENYLTNRKQCVKVGTTLSNWQDIYKGVPVQF